MDSLLIVERFVLESLGNKKKTYSQLREETKLNDLFLKNILSGMTYKNLISYTENKYQINTEFKQVILKNINKKENLKDEVKELFTTFVNEFFLDEAKRTNLNVKKVNLNKLEESILDSHMKNLSDFFNGLSPAQDECISNQRVVMWGDCNYLNLVNRSLA